MKHPRSVWTLYLLLTLGIQGCAVTTTDMNNNATIHQEMALIQPDASTQNRKIGENVLEKYPPKVLQVVERYDLAVRLRLIEDFKRAKVAYPPARMGLLAFKKEQRMELWGGEMNGPLKLIKTYPFTAFSGELGPKRRQGDRQIPEGIYRIIFLNPESSYHLSMKLNYPNDFDRTMAATERRNQLGGDIFIHGDSYSIGCIALGDRAIEELFVLTAWAGMDNVQVIVSPYDLRQEKEIKPLHKVPWTKELYTQIQHSLLAFNQQP